MSNFRFPVEQKKRISTTEQGNTKQQFRRKCAWLRLRNQDGSSAEAFALRTRERESQKKIEKIEFFSILKLLKFGETLEMTKLHCDHGQSRDKCIRLCTYSV